jgi:hypothetical protein
MKCSWCGSENPDDARFCGNCGASILTPISPKPHQSKHLVNLTRRKISRKEIGTLIIAILLIAVAAGIFYYNQPVSGNGWVSATTVGPGEIVSFGFHPTQGLQPFTYVWSFGDGEQAFEQSPTHVYTVPGTYHVSVIVTDAAGKQFKWTTNINVRSPLVFIDSVTYPSYMRNPLGDTEVYLYLDGQQVIKGVSNSINPGSGHSIEIKIVWVIIFTPEFVKRDTFVEDKGDITAPITQIDLHCVLKYDPYPGTDGLKFALIPT